MEQVDGKTYYSHPFNEDGFDFSAVREIIWKVKPSKNELLKKFIHGSRAGKDLLRARKRLNEIFISLTSCTTVDLNSHLHYSISLIMNSLYIFGSKSDLVERIHPDLVNILTTESVASSRIPKNPIAPPICYAVNRILNDQYPEGGLISQLEERIPQFTKEFRRGYMLTIVSGIEWDLENHYYELYLSFFQTCHSCPIGSSLALAASTNEEILINAAKMKSLEDSHVCDVCASPEEQIKINSFKILLEMGDAEDEGESNVPTIEEDESEPSSTKERGCKTVSESGSEGNGNQFEGDDLLQLSKIPGLTNLNFVLKMLNDGDLKGACHHIYSSIMVSGVLGDLNKIATRRDVMQVSEEVKKGMTRIERMIEMNRPDVGPALHALNTAANKLEATSLSLNQVRPRVLAEQLVINQQIPIAEQDPPRPNVSAEECNRIRLAEMKERLRKNKNM